MVTIVITTRTTTKTTGEPNAWNSQPEDLRCISVASTSRLHLRNDLYCVGWGVKLYSLTHSRPNCFSIIL